MVSNYPKLSLFRENKISDDLKNEFGRNVVLLYVGGLTKDRGTLESIQALQKIVKKVAYAKLVFLGEFKGDAEHKEEAKMIGENGRQAVEKNKIGNGCRSSCSSCMRD